MIRQSGICWKNKIITDRMIWNHHRSTKWKKTVGLSTRFQMHDKMFVYIFSVQSFHIMMTPEAHLLWSLIILFLQMKSKHFPQFITSNVMIVGISYTCILISSRMLIVLITHQPCGCHNVSSKGSRKNL